MGEIHVNFESLQAGQAGIDSNFKRLLSTLEDLETGLQPMIDAWSGAAQEAYLVCKQQWDQAAQELAAVLNAVSRAVGTANDNYLAAHEATVQIWA